METIVVVGANHAGTSAINTILDHHEGKNVVAFDSNSNISFLGCGMALWIGNQIAGPEGLFYSNKDTLEGKGAKIYLETPVNEVDFDKKIVYAKDKEGNVIEQNYDKLILATGSTPILPRIEGTDLENVQFVKLYQNAADVIDKLKCKEIQKVVIVGAGYIGVELAEAFKRNGRDVTIIDVADTCLSGYYDHDFSEAMAENLRENGVKTAFGEKVLKLEGNKKVEKVITDGGEYPADMVILAIGFRPNNELGKGKLELFANGAYLVNKSQETSIKDVYAIGDCATVYDNSVQEINYIALATNAVRSGIIAGHSASGKPMESVGVQGSNAINIWDLKLVSTGLTYEKATRLGYDAGYTEFEDYQKPTFIAEDNYKVKIRIVYDKKSRIVLGAQMCSKYDISMGIHMFSLAIQEQLTIDRLKLLDVFFLPHFNQPFNYINMALLNTPDK